MTVRWMRRRRLIRAAWWTSAGEGSWLTRQTVRFVEAELSNPRPKAKAA